MVQFEKVRKLLKWNKRKKCDTMGGIRFSVCGCGCLSEDPFVCFGAKPTQRVRLPTRPEEDERRKVSERTEETSRQTGAVDRSGQSTDQDSQQESAVDRSREKPTGRTCGIRGRVGQRERMSQRSGWLCENFARIHAQDISQKLRRLGQCHKLFLSSALS